MSSYTYVCLVPLSLAFVLLVTMRAANAQFHTVSIRADLPKIEKQYHAEQPKNLPEDDFWISDVISYLSGNRWGGGIQRDRFKMQHMISNAPCKSYKYHFFRSNSEFFRHFIRSRSRAVSCLSQRLQFARRHRSFTGVSHSSLASVSYLI